LSCHFDTSKNHELELDLLGLEFSENGIHSVNDWVNHSILWAYGNRVDWYDFERNRTKN